MTTVLFATLDAGGNLPPALAIARAVVDAGGSARFLAAPAQQARIAAAGFPVEPYVSARRFVATEPGNLVAVSLRQARAFADRGAGRDIVASYRRSPTDVVVVDCLLVGGAAEALAAGLPVVSLVHTLFSFFDRAVDGPLGRVIRMLGVDAPAILHAPGTKLVTAIPEFESPVEAAGLHHVGPTEAIGAVAAAPTHPRVLVSSSTAAVPGQDRMLQRILDALDGLSALVTTGPAIDPRRLRVPTGVDLRAYADHTAELPTVSLVVSHGGHGTTARALAHGTPVLVLPANPLTDQPVIGAAVARLGVGETLPARAKPAAIRAAIDRLLADGPVRDAASALGRRLRDQHPGEAAVRVLEEAAHRVR
jgi:UDP:flavonoid glycosyltransferase YjiC (YdhE family)